MMYYNMIHEQSQYKSLKTHRLNHQWITSSTRNRWFTLKFKQKQIKEKKTEKEAISADGVLRRRRAAAVASDVVIRIRHERKMMVVEHGLVKVTEAHAGPSAQDRRPFRRPGRSSCCCCSNRRGQRWCRRMAALFTLLRASVLVPHFNLNEIFKLLTMLCNNANIKFWCYLKC